MPLDLTAPTRDSELTSGFTRRAIRFVLIRVGVNSSETPKGLYVTVICPAWFPGVGIGISPPARNRSYERIYLTAAAAKRNATAT